MRPWFGKVSTFVLIVLLGIIVKLHIPLSLAPKTRTKQLQAQQPHVQLVQQVNAPAPLEQRLANHADMAAVVAVVTEAVAAVVMEAEVVAVMEAEVVAVMEAEVVAVVAVEMGRNTNQVITLKPSVCITPVLYLAFMPIMRIQYSTCSFDNTEAGAIALGCFAVLLIAVVCIRRKCKKSSSSVPHVPLEGHGDDAQPQLSKEAYAQL